jgi:uncharacterized phage protein (TIGR02220 family)
MAQDKKSFLLYCDIIHTVTKLTDVDAGQLFKHLLKYVNDLNPVTENILVDIAFEPIKQQLKRDLKKYESIREKRSDAGIASALAKKEKSTHVKCVKQTSTKSTVNDNVNVNVINNIICHLNNKTKKDFKTNSKKTQSCIKARLNDGYSYEDFIKVIDIKSLKWNNDPKMKDFLRPETLFGSKFESYLNEETKQVQRPKIDVSTKFEYVEGWKDERE